MWWPDLILTGGSWHPEAKNWGKKEAWSEKETVEPGREVMSGLACGWTWHEADAP